MTTPIPTLLTSQLTCPPSGSLTLVTDVLGAPATWIHVRLIYSVLSRDRTPAPPAPAGENARSGGQGSNGNAVILVSWLRDWEYWADAVRRSFAGTGLDLVSPEFEGRFVMVDGLSSFFNADIDVDLPSSSLPGRAAPKRRRLTSPSTKHIYEVVSTAISQLQSAHPNRNITLILDYPSILLETSMPPSKSTDLTTLILRLRSQVHSTIIGLPADLPLVKAATAEVPQACTPLEVENAAFLVGCVHESRLMISTRRLETGWAADVSGILRCTRGGGVEDEGGYGDGKAMEQGEWLYYLGADGSARVWTR